MGGSVRSLVPGVALAVAGVVALSPTLVAPSIAGGAQPAVEIPAVYVEDIALAGIGRDIYDSITAFVQYTVSSAQYWIDLVPVVGPPIADQIGITYFTLIQPVVASTVYFISDVIANPFAIVQLTANYGSNLFYAGYNWVSQEAQFFGLPPLPLIPPPPPLAATRGGAAAVEAPAADTGATTRVRAAAAVAAPAAEAPAAEAPAESGSDPRAGARSARQGARAAAGETAQTAAAGAAGRKTRAEARASRGSAGADEAAGAADGAADGGATAD